MKTAHRRLFGIAAAVLAALVLPALSGVAPYMSTLACYALIAALVAVSLDLLMGNTALLSFGHAAWYGLGSYAGGLFAKTVSAELLLVLPCCLLVAALAAWPVGQVLVRQAGKSFAILTLALGQILFALVYVGSAFTGGEDGLQGIPPPTLLGWRLAGTGAWYWLLLGLVGLALAGLLRLRRTPIGRSWLAIRQNEQRAAFIGIDVHRLKLAAYVASAALASVAGGLFALFAGATTPENLNWFESGRILMYVILGGTGTIVGPALGAVVFTFAEYFVSSRSEAWLMYFGGLFVLVVIVAPGGIHGYLRRWWPWGGAHAR